ncbi:MFS family permease [Catenuloplanes nepalensis]|uniref:MFS family permease n=1 Tax=Catenuloplanes nepalensis TaxID=587533 RepID=A0ABT9N7W0_9ACTN|nr:MFS transporter [Catenuloplanes nepalensis]MDP9799787.1 MFS family permease [Catenuloplanes nepalensis]
MRGGGGRVHRSYSVVVFVVLASLDNVVIGIAPPLYGRIGDGLDVSRGAIAGVISLTYLVSAVASVAWAYSGDRTDRKRLLMSGTLVWAAGTAGTALSGNFVMFVLAQLIAAAGLGAVSSVGFSVVTDLITPRRRGLVMAFFGLAQGVGSLTGTLLGGLAGNADWRRPFMVLTVAGLVATVAYLFTYDIRRGEAEPELAGTADYDYRISRADLPRIWRNRSNVWLVAQGLTAQVAFGSLVWLPVLFTERAKAQGYDDSTAVVVGTIFTTLFQLGGALSIIGGVIGDRLQRRTPRGRALVAAVGVLGALPFYGILFYVPMKITVPDGGSSGEVVAAVLASVVTEPTVALSLITAFTALAFTSANSPNWFALIGDVNLPEHRGTVYSIGNLVNSLGRAGGNALIGVAAKALAGAFPPPLNYAAGLALFQLFFVPTGIMYWLASRTAPKDIADVHATLLTRATTNKDQQPSEGTATAST